MVNFARKVTEERLKECLPVPSFEDEHSKVLVTLMSALMDEENYEIDPETDTLKTKDDFLKDIEDSFGLHSEGQVIKERIDDVKNKLLERIKETTVKNKERRMSISITGSVERKRRNSTEPPNEKHAVRTKMSSFSVSS